jgi:hypothetical protein
MNYMMEEINGVTIAIIKKVLTLNKIIEMVYEGKSDNFSYIKEEDKDEYMELIAPIINGFEIELESILKIEDGVKQYEQLQLLNTKLKDIGLYTKSLNGSNFLKMYKRSVQ